MHPISMIMLNFEIKNNTPIFGLNLSWITCNSLKTSLITSVPTFRGSIPRRKSADSSQKSVNSRNPNYANPSSNGEGMSEEDDE